MNTSGLLNVARRAPLLAALLAFTGALAGAAATGATATSRAQPARAAEQPSADTLDTIIFKDGRVVKGTVVAQTDTTVTLKGEVNGIAFKTEYSRADILSLKIAEKPAATPKATPAGKPEAKPDPKPAPKAADSADPAAKKVYVIELSGEFGRDISETPIRESAKDAQKLGADVIVVVMDHSWVFQVPGEDERNADNVSAFDQLFRAEDMDQIFTEEIPRWEKPPRVVFWVKRAMGGPAFLTLASPEIYFHSDARLGGVGWVNQMLAGIGDDVVARKQVSLRLAHAEGIAVRSGYPTEVVRALAITEYVLSASFDGGTPLLFERMPQDDSEVLLTDNGAGENRDTAQKAVAGEGNDILTLNAKVARDLRISKGTVDTLDDLIFELGISHNAQVVKGRSGQIMKGWRDGVDKAIRDVRRLLEELNEAQPGGSFEERTKARTRTKRILDDISKIIQRYGEALGRSEMNRIVAILTDTKNQVTHQQQEDAMAQRRK